MASSTAERRRSPCWGPLCLALTLAAIAALPAVEGGAAAAPAPSAARRGPAQRGDAAETPLGFEREMLAGAVARAAAQVVMYPADVMKTLAQVCSAPREQPVLPACSSSPGPPPPMHACMYVQARSRHAGLSVWEMGAGKLLNGAVTTSFLALPAGMPHSVQVRARRQSPALVPFLRWRLPLSLSCASDLQFGIFPHTKRSPAPVPVLRRRAAVRHLPYCEAGG